MQIALAVIALAAAASAAPGYVAPATHLVRTPQFDSAVIKSDRLGGNFAYSTVEAQAYAAVSPVVQKVVTPVAVSYHATPIVPAYAPAPVVHAAPAAVPAYAPAPVVHAAPIVPAYAPAYAPAPYYHY